VAVQPETKHKSGIKRKIVVLICSITLIVVVVGCVIGYSWTYRLIHKIVAECSQHSAQMLATAIEQLIDKEVDAIETFADNPIWKDACKESNAKYEDMELSTVLGELSQLNQQWIAAFENNPLVRKYLDNPAAVKLRLIAEEHPNIAEIFITDKFGGLVASSKKTTDFYQADERWWQLSFADGKGGIFIGDVEFDESSNVQAMPLGIPIKDGSQIVGICKSVININAFFSVLDDFTIGESGKAFAIGGDGYPLASSRIDKAKYYPEKERQDFFQKSARWLSWPKGYNRRTFVGVAAIRHPLLIERNIYWKIAVTQYEQEALRPLQVLFLRMLSLFALLVIIVIPVGFIFGGRFAKPILKLSESVRNIRRGNLAPVVGIRTGDEIEELTDVLNTTIDNLLASTTSVENLNREIKTRKKVEEVLQVAYANLKKTKDQLVQAEKMAALGKLSAAVAHEVNNPLNVISGYVEMLSNETKDKDAKRIAKLIIQQSQRAAKIVTRLLDFSKPSKPQFRLIDINKLIEDSIKLLPYEVDLENIKINKELASDLPKVQADLGQLQEVFINIATNAVEAMTKKGTLTIKTYTKFTDKKQQLALEISDTGKGIPEKRLAKLFDPFFSAKEGGVGLGLAICEGIIHAHKGNIEVQSRAGVGTTFIIQFPISKGAKKS